MMSGPVAGARGQPRCVKVAPARDEVSALRGKVPFSLRGIGRSARIM